MISFALLFLVVLPLSFVALAIWFRNAIGQRVGSEPHCRRCNYLLIGISPERCPECGTVLLPGNVVHGIRKRRPTTVIALGLMVLLSIVLIFPIMQLLRNIEWYHYKPTYLVMRDVRSSSVNDACDAMLELSRRDGNGSLAEKDRKQIIQIALAQQGMPINSQFASEAVAFLETQYTAGRLLETERKQFFAQSEILKLSVRPVVVQGENVPFIVSEQCRIVGPNWWVKILSLDGAEVDGVMVSGFGSGSSTGSGLGSSGSIVNSIKCPKTLGKHQLTVTMRVELHQGRFGDETIAPVFSEDRKLMGEFEVIGKLTTQNAVAISDSNIDDEIRRSISLTSLTIDSNRRKYLQASFRLQKPPANLTFSLFLRVDRREERFAMLTAGQGIAKDIGAYGPISDAMFNALAGKADLILRSDETAARQTVDLKSIWPGEIVFPNVSVVGAPSR